MSQLRVMRRPPNPASGTADSAALTPTKLLASALRTPFPVLLLILCYLTPFTITVGGLALTPVRVVLISGFIPAVATLIRSGRFHACDFLIIFHSFWVAVTFGANHGLEQAIKSGGVYGVEVVSAYLFGRCFIRTREQFLSVIALLFIFILVILPFVVIEAKQGWNLFRLVSGQNWHRYDQRFGIYRAAGPFPHAILNGLFCAGTLAVFCAAQRIGKTPALTRRLQQCVVAGSAMASVSSGAAVVLSIQLYLLLWERFSRSLRNRWMILCAIISAGYLVIEALSNRSGIMVLLNYLSFSSHTAYWRTIIFEWGMKSVWKYPIFGIGFNEWERPPYMYSGSMDNFWLVVAVRHGLPAFLSLAAAVLMILWLNGRAAGTTSAAGDPEMASMRLRYNISIIGLVVGGCTVHFWSSMVTHFSFLLGLGVTLLRLPTKPTRSGARW